MRRVSLVGGPGSGKTTLGRRLASSLGVPFIELDAVFHQAGWVELPVEEFRDRVSEAVAADGWVADGNYGAVRDLVWARADTVVWIDLPRRVVMRRVMLRTIGRAISRRELWNGNREPLTNFYRWDPEQNIVRWTWITYPDYAARYRAAMDEPPRPGLRFIRIASDGERRRLVEEACRGRPGR